jgi:CMP-N,N'-diacetyllegionaminic acid synthase
MGHAASCVALIPARAGSKRVADKNVRLLGGHPLLAYAVAAARDAGVFARVIVSTDSSVYAEIARHYGAEVPCLRPDALAGDLSPDIDWVEFTLTTLADAGERYESFSILRPTSPFRQPSTIQRAFRQFLDDPAADSLRAVEKCRQHPGKMWVVRGPRMTPVLPFWNDRQPWHSSQYQALPEVYVQNASLEIAWSRVVFEGRTIAGDVIAPFLTHGYEGFDINRPEDWTAAETLLSSGAAYLPVVATARYRQGGSIG